MALWASDLTGEWRYTRYDLKSEINHLSYYPVCLENLQNYKSKFLAPNLSAKDDINFMKSIQERRLRVWVPLKLETVHRIRFLKGPGILWAKWIRAGPKGWSSTDEHYYWQQIIEIRRSDSILIFTWDNTREPEEEDEQLISLISPICRFL